MANRSILFFICFEIRSLEGGGGIVGWMIIRVEVDNINYLRTKMHQELLNGAFVIYGGPRTSEQNRISLKNTPVPQN